MSYHRDYPTEKILTVIFMVPACLFILTMWLMYGLEKLKAYKADNGDVTFEKILESPKENWLTYSGDYAAKRYSPLNQINVGNVSRLVPKWVYHVEEETGNLRVTPLVYEGVMYLTNAYEAEALDAAPGQRLWYWRAPEWPTHWMNRGAALLGDKVFFITGDCVLTALDRKTGKLKWQKKYASGKEGYSSTVAPLALKDKIIVGVSGGEDGARGFVAAFSADSGEELWRFWTIPENSKLKGGGATWVTGSYDPELNLLYWTAGSPYFDSKNEVLSQETLYSNSVLALNPDNGKLKWHFQFMPYDARHWDANEIPVLFDARNSGKLHKFLGQAHRNGFFYLLDRTNGDFLLGKSFVKKMTWAKGLGSNGHPVEMPSMNGPWTKEKKGICPGLTGATNWNSPSFSPQTKLFYVVAQESCDVEHDIYFLRALDPLMGGRIKWEYKMPGPGSMYAGVVSTAGGLVFVGDDANHLVALDAATGQKLWQFSMGTPIFASPMTYAVGGKQYVAIASGSNIFSFGLFGN